MKRWIRGLVVGNKRYFDSWTEYRQVMLSGQFGLIGISAFLFFMIVDVFRGDFLNLPVFSFGIGLIVLSMYFHRNGRHCLANSILYPSLILIIFLFTASESPSNGGLVFYIPVVVGAFACFDYRDRKMAVMVAGLATLSFMASTYFEINILPFRHYSKEQMLFNMLIYFLVAIVASLAAISVLITLNHRNAKKLLTSNGLLKKSNEELDRFVYSTSHDLRAPLTSVMGLINLSESSNDINELRSYLTMMKGRVHALDKFIRDITDYSRNNRTSIDRVKVNLHQLALEIWNSLRHNQKAEKINFVTDIADETYVETDPHRLQVILSNLISNSIRYHDSNKTDQYIKLGYKRTEKSFVLFVEDNGQGIAEEYHDRIFQMFFRANEKSSGSGLGLYIVKEAIDRLSGKVQLQSVLSEGSTFIISIPTGFNSASNSVELNLQP